MKYKYRNQLSLLAFLMMAGGTQLAAQAEQAVDPHGMERILGNTLVWVIGAVIAMTFGALIYVVNLLMDAQKLRLLQEHGVEVMEKAGLVKKESWWQRANKQAWKLIPVEKEKDILFDHEYDGIRELDNSLPPWWVAMFYITIVFAVAYLGYFHISGYGVDQATEYAMEMERAEEAVQAHLAKQADRVDENNVIALEDPKDIALGETIFTTYCSACHGQLGEGGVGPNLTDEYWVNGGGITDVFKTIKYGVPAKGMISWEAQLTPVQIQEVASYVISLQGSNPENAREPQGEIWKEGDAVATDSETNEESAAAADEVEEIELLTDAASIANGKMVFDNMCIACHGASGGSMPGGIGQNLTDEYWLQGGGISNIYHTIKVGVPAKGMIAWESSLSPQQMQEVASYIVSLGGTNPDGAKEPQGEKWEAK